MIGIPDAAPYLLSMKAGSLDPEYSNIAPIDSEAYVVNRRAYMKAFDGLTQYDGMVPL